MNILGIDTTESNISIAIINENRFMSAISVNEKNKTASMLIPYIDYILKQAEKEINNIDLISICSGPGSYTSLRIGYSTVKTLCIVNNIKMTEISRFELMARTVLEYNHKLTLKSKLSSNMNNKISVLLPTTYKKLMIQHFEIISSENNNENKELILNNNLLSELIELSEPMIIEKKDFIDYYSLNHPLVIGVFKNHKKINDFTEIIQLDNYYEYIDRGSSGTFLSEIGFDKLNKGLTIDPYYAEPLYLSSPF